MGYWRETMGSTPFAHFRRGVFLLPIALGFFATGAHAAAKPAFVQKAYFQITSGSSVSVTLRRTPVCARRIPSTWVSATGSGSLASSGALTTAASSELLFAAGMTGAVFTAPGSGFTSRIVTSPDGDLVEDAVAASPGSYTATASLSGGIWQLQLAAFQGA